MDRFARGVRLPAKKKAMVVPDIERIKPASTRVERRMGIRQGL